MKTINSLITEAETKQRYWRNVSNSETLLEQLKKTREQALCLESFFEGKADGFFEAKRLMK